MDGKLPKWSLVQGRVVDHMPYGLRVRVPSGEIGVLDSMFLGDVPVARQDWPPAGAEITVVSGGYTSGGQLRLSARPSHIEQARAMSGDAD